ncbi:MAG TPA: hypothetical protein VNJ04_20870 [Gemmatimonadaceae bacterium]|nr:hypothetical protein [Gemmatimonadaceae bacterium]
MRKRLIALLAVTLVGAGCAPSRTPGPRVESEVTTLLVENQGYLDMTIYVLRSSQRVRIGTAGGSKSSRFTIPPDLISGIGVLTFIADPIGSSRTSVSEQIMVTPGDQIVLTIPPR